MAGQGRLSCQEPSSNRGDNTTEPSHRDAGTPRASELTGQDVNFCCETCRRGYLFFALHWQSPCRLSPGWGSWPGRLGFQGPDDDPSGHPGLPLRALGLWGVSPSMSFSLLPSCTLLFQCSDGPLQMQRGPGVASWGRRAGGRWSKRRHVSYHQPAPHREPPPLPTTPAGLAPPPSSWVTPDGSASIHETSETVPLRRWL